MKRKKDNIKFPFPKPPAPGEIIEIETGIFWARMPLPMLIDHAFGSSISVPKFKRVHLWACGADILYGAQFLYAGYKGFHKQGLQVNLSNNSIWKWSEST